MAYLLDTDVLIYHIKGVSTANQLVYQLIDAGLAISSITYMEVSDGLHAVEGTLTHDSQFGSFLTGTRVLDFGQPEAQISAHLRWDLRQRGRSVRARALDVMIAATAVTHQLTLVTNNPSDFRDIPGLQVEPANIHV